MALPFRSGSLYFQASSTNFNPFQVFMAGHSAPYTRQTQKRYGFPLLALSLPDGGTPTSISGQLFRIIPIASAAPAARNVTSIMGIPPAISARANGTASRCGFVSLTTGTMPISEMHLNTSCIVNLSFRISVNANKRRADRPKYLTVLPADKRLLNIKASYQHPGAYTELPDYQPPLSA